MMIMGLFNYNTSEKYKNYGLINVDKDSHFFFPGGKKALNFYIFKKHCITMLEGTSLNIPNLPLL